MGVLPIDAHVDQHLAAVPGQCHPGDTADHHFAEQQGAADADAADRRAPEGQCQPDGAALAQGEAILARALARARLDEGSLDQGIEMGDAAQPQLGLHQGEPGPGLQEARGILLIQLGLEAHLTEGGVQFDLLHLADVDPPIADGAAHPEPGIALGGQRQRPHPGSGLLLAVEQLMTAAAGAEPIKFDAAAQQGGEVPHLDLYPVQPDLAVDGRFLPELGLLLEQGRIDGIDLQGDLHAAVIRLQPLDLAGLQSQIEDRRADADAIRLFGAQQPVLWPGVAGAKQGQFLTGVEPVDALTRGGLDQLDPARQPGARRAGVHLDTAQIGLDLQGGGAIETRPLQQVTMVLVHQQADAGIALGIQGQGTYLADLQAFEPERRAFAQAGEIVGLQGQLDAAALGLTLQSHGADPGTRHVVEPDGRPRQQPIRVLEPARGERHRLPDEAALAGHSKCLLRVDQGGDNPALLGQTDGINPANLDPLIEDGHPFLDRQITRLDADALTPRRFGQSLVEGEVQPLLGDRRLFGGVERYAATQDGGEAAGLHIDAGQAEGALDAADVPEAGVHLDQMFEARLDHQIQDHILVVLAEAGVDDAADLEPTEVDLGADADRSQRIGGQVQGPPLGLITGGRAVLGIELILQRVVVPAGLQVDVVAGDQGIEAGDLGQRGLGAHQPERGALADQRPGTAVYLGQHRYLATILSQYQLLHHPDGDPLIAYLGLARQNAVALGKVDANDLTTARPLLVDETARQQQRYDGQ
ncbi:hypothetical protein D3C84_202100 [compost metagenome]